MNNYKIGDKVTIRKDLVVNRQYGTDKFVPSMQEYLGATTTIIGYNEEMEWYFLEIDDESWNWTSEMFEKEVLEDENT